MIALLLFMAAILNPKDIGAAKNAPTFIQPIYDVIHSEADMVLVKKSVRIGMTWASAFADVRDSLRYPKRDTLFTTKDQNTAFEYVGYCTGHLEIFKQTRSIISKSDSEMEIPVFDSDGKESSMVEKITVSTILFDNGSRIKVFSSNPNAILAFGGNVRWDEAAFHPNGQRMWSAINTRMVWGGDCRVWSSLSAEDTMFDVLADEAEKPDSGWEYHHIDIHEAVKEGLVPILNEATGKNYTDEEFIGLQKMRSTIPGLFELNYEISKGNTKAAIVSWVQLKSCTREYTIERDHLSQEAIEKKFGNAAFADAGNRRKKVEEYLREQEFSKLFSSKPKRWRIGFDVAASRKGDLASIWIDEKTAEGLILRGNLTFQTEDWDVMQWCMEFFFSYLPGEVKGCGDETGLGKQICWNLAKRYAGMFEGVNFSGHKTPLGTLLMTELAAKAKILPATEPEIVQDVFAIKKGMRKGKQKNELYFYESKNPLLAASHADIGWSGALASYADREMTSEYWGATT